MEYFSLSVTYLYTVADRFLREFQSTYYSRHVNNNIRYTTLNDLKMNKKKVDFTIKIFKRKE